MEIKFVPRFDSSSFVCMNIFNSLFFFSPVWNWQLNRTEPVADVKWKEKKNINPLIYRKRYGKISGQVIRMVYQWLTEQ